MCKSNETHQVTPPYHPQLYGISCTPKLEAKNGLWAFASLAGAKTGALSLGVKTDGRLACWPRVGDRVWFIYIYIWFGFSMITKVVSQTRSVNCTGQKKVKAERNPQ